MRTGLRLGITAALAALVAGCSAHDAEQVIRKDPGAVFDAFVDAFAASQAGSMTRFGPAAALGYEVKLDKTRDEKLDVTVLLNKAKASEVHFTFTPQNGGAETLVTADVAVDQAVMREAFAGTPQEKLSQVPDLAYRVGMQRMLKEWAERIEDGLPLAEGAESWMEPEHEPSPAMAAQERRWEEQERRQAATKPMVDPGADARKYLNGSN